MELFNTLTEQVAPFEPAGPVATIYVCGITPYDTTHLGHAFTYAVADVLIRYLEYQGRAVSYVQNVTDIDDDILRKAKTVEDNWQELGDRWTAHFIRDLQTLNVRPPDYFPRATDVIPEIIELVQRLLQAGLAYESAGNVYFAVNRWEDYGKLSHIPRADMLPIANERGNRADDPHKQAPLDFVLWQAKADGEPAWDSPWGEGRPGWHIECSTMASRYLGNTIDVHSGGSDLIFPHHESEIAQIEPVSGQKPFVRFWMHTAMVHHEGEKMSKSLGNLVMVRDLLKDWSPDALRLYLASHHYRQIWRYDEAELKAAAGLAEALKAAVTVRGGSETSLDVADLVAAFTTAMDDDLDTPTALTVLGTLASRIQAAATANRDISEAQDTLRAFATIFGLRLAQADVEPRVSAGWNTHLQRFV